MKDIPYLHEAGAVKRWHTKPTLKDQDLASHSWGVATILMYILPGNYNVLRAALVHDLHEKEAGDIPYQFKKSNPNVSHQYSLQDHSFQEKYEISTELLEFEQEALKWADMMELLLFCHRELRMGNQYFSSTRQVAEKTLRDMGHPNEQARTLFNEVIHHDRDYQT